MNRTEIERLAKSANGLRPDWPWNSLATFLETHLVDRAYRDVAVALAYVAADPETRTPKRVLEAGPWWQVGAAAERKPTESGIATYCEHGRRSGLHCDGCTPVTRTLPTAEQRAAIRAAIDASKTTTTTERTTP